MLGGERGLAKNDCFYDDFVDEVVCDTHVSIVAGSARLDVGFWIRRCRSPGRLFGVHEEKVRYTRFESFKTPSRTGILMEIFCELEYLMEASYMVRCWRRGRAQRSTYLAR